MALLEGRNLRAVPPEQALPLIVGIAVAAVSGYVALRIVLRIVRGGDGAAAGGVRNRLWGRRRQRKT